MAWVQAMESGALAVPGDVHDREAWDRYWRTQLAVGTIEQGFNDMMASDPRLVPLLIERGVTSILCAGNGLSSEACALALHGFDVTALDIASIPAAVQRSSLIDGPPSSNELRGEEQECEAQRDHRHHRKSSANAC